MIYIYRTTNLKNGKTYIGQHKTKDIMNDKYIGSGVLIQRAIKKYGKENFKNEILEIVFNKIEANALERFYIKKERDLGKAEYNISAGGDGCRGIIAWNRGLHLSEEQKQKISESHKGKKVIHSKETIEKIKKSNIGKNKGKIKSEDAKKKISKARKGKHLVIDENGKRHYI